jgi:uncharacterized protein YdaU (DUF1376 family)
MSKEQSPAFQWYAAEYLADENVQLMTMEEEGCYCRLISFCWREGSIPSDPQLLARLCKGVVPSELVTGCFNHPSADTTRLLHPRLEVERAKQEEWRKKSALGGKRSAHKRKHRKGLDPQQGGTSTVPRVVVPIGNSSSSSSIASSNTPPVVPQWDNGNEQSALFALFWQYYPRHEAKKHAFKTFLRLKATRELVESWIPWLTEAAQSVQWQDKNTIPHAATWLNQRRWEDDPPPMPRKQLVYKPDTVGANNAESGGWEGRAAEIRLKPPEQWTATEREIVQAMEARSGHE